MNKIIDEQIVQMSFDNSKFESNVNTSLKTIEKLKSSLNFNGVTKGLSAIGNIDMRATSDGIELCTKGFSMLGAVGLRVLQNITNNVTRLGENLARSVTVAPIIDGLREYETQMESVQTILANTKSKGSTLDDVNAALDDLNHYADKTIYNFTQMTANIGRFTAAGVGLEESKEAIKGIANLAAVSGSTSQQASTAMYQLSQALATGTVKLQDWNSVVNASMGGEVFQEALKRTSRVMGTGVDEAIKKYGTFRDSLTQGGWLTKEVLSETLKQIAGSYTEADLAAQGFKSEQIKEILDLAKTAEDAATKVKTFHQLIDTLKEALGSGWAMTWRTVIGDFEQARELWTSVNDVLSGIINDSSDARNAIISEWADFGGRQSAILAVKATFENLKAVMGEVKKAFETVIPPVTAQTLLRITSSVREFAKSLKPTADQLWAIRGIAQGVFGIFKILGDGIVKLGSILGGAVKKFLEFTDASDKLSKTLDVLGQIGYLISDIARFGVTSATASDKLMRLVKTVPALKVAIDAVSAASSVLRLAFTAVSVAAQKVWDTISPLTSKISTLFAKSDNSGTIEKLSGVLNRIKDTADKLTESLTKTDEEVTKVTTSVKTNFGDSLEYVDTTFNAITAIHDKIAERISSIVNKIKTVVGGIAEAFSSTFQKATGMSGGLGFASILTAVAGAFAIVSKIMRPAIDFMGILRSIKNELLGSGSVFQKIKNGLDAGIAGLKQLKNVLLDYQKSIQVKMIKDVAIAVAILAGSLVVLSMVKPEKLLSGIVAMGALMLMLSGTFNSFLSMIKNFNINAKATAKVIALLYGLSGAILLFSLAIRIVASADPARTAVGTLALVGAMYAMIGALKLMSKLNISGVSANIESLFGIAAAILVLSFAVKNLANLNFDQLVMGLSGVAGLLTGIAVFLAATKGSTLGAKTGLSILAISVAINLLAVAVKNFSKMQPEKMLQGIAGLYAVLLAVAGFDKMMSSGNKSATKARLSIMLLSMAMVKLAKALQIFVGLVGSGSKEDLIKYAAGLGGFVVALAAVSVALFGLGKVGKSVKSGGAALLIAAIGIRILASAVQEISKVGNIKDTLILLGASLAELAIAMALMKNSLQGAAAMAVVAVSLSLLAPALKMLSTLDMAKTALGLLLVVGAIGALALIGYAVQPVAPALIAIAGALLVISLAAVGISAAIFGIAAAILMLSGAIISFASIGPVMVSKALETIKGLFSGVLQIIASLAGEFVNTLSIITQALTAYLPIFGMFITTLGRTLLTSINANLPMLFTVIDNFVTRLMQLVIDKAPQFKEMVSVILTSLFTLIQEKVPEFMETVGVVIDSILTLIRDKIPEFVNTALDVITSVLTALNLKLPLIVQLGTTLVVNLINGIAAAIPQVLQAGFNLAISFMNGIGDTFRKNGPAVGEAARNMFEGIIEGMAAAIVPGGDKLIKGFKEIIEKVLTKLKEFASKFTDVGKMYIDGLVNGLSKIGSKISNAAAKLGDTVKNSTAKALDEKSPSKAAEQQGVYYGEGLEHGINKKADDVSDAAFKMGRGAIDSMNEALDEHSESKEGIKSGEFIDGGVVTGVDNEADSVSDAVGNMAQGAVDTLNDTLSNAKGAAEPLVKSVYQATMTIDDINAKHAKKTEETNDKIVDSNKYTYIKTTETYNGITRTYMKQVPVVEAQQEAAVASEEEAVDKSTKTKEKHVASTKEFWTNLLEASKNGADGIKYQNMELADFEKDVLQKTSDIIDDYKNKITDSAREMADKDLFKKVSERSEVSAQELMENLKGQIDEINNYTNVMNSLNTRISSTALKDAINDMGVESLSELEALNSMTDEQLTEYTNLYDQKYSASLSQLKAKAQNELSSLYGGVSINIDAFAATFDGSLASIESYFNSSNVQAKMAKAGENVTAGIGEGMKSNEALKAIDKSSEKIENHTDKKALPTAFDSHSPAKKTIPQGVNITKGVAKGMNEPQAYLSIDTAAKTLMLYLLKAIEKAYDASNIKAKAAEIGKSIGNEISKGIKKGTNKEAGKKDSKGYTDGIVSGIKTMRSAVAVESSAISESTLKSFRSTMSTLASLEDFDTSPVIAPVMDLSNIQNGIYAMNGMMSNADAYAVAADVSTTFDAKKIAKLNESLDMQRALTSMRDANAARSDEIAELQTAVSKLSDTIGDMSGGNTTNISPTFNIQSNDPKAVADEVNRSLQRMIDRRSAVWA